MTSAATIVIFSRHDSSLRRRLPVRLHGANKSLRDNTTTVANSPKAAFPSPCGVRNLKKNVREILDGLADGTVDAVFGTHALIQKDVLFSNLGLVITDEQHRFGVAQRGELWGKGAAPNTVVMTATPIPRTLALILYGDLNISSIDQLPPGRKPVATYAVPLRMEKRLSGFVKNK